jgi:hypothetical protein
MLFDLLIPKIDILEENTMKPSIKWPYIDKGPNYPICGEKWPNVDKDPTEE